MLKLFIWVRRVFDIRIAFTVFRQACWERCVDTRVSYLSVLINFDKTSQQISESSVKFASAILLWRSVKLNFSFCVCGQTARQTWTERLGRVKKRIYSQMFSCEVAITLKVPTGEDNTVYPSLALFELNLGIDRKTNGLIFNPHPNNLQSTSK